MTKQTKAILIVGAVVVAGYFFLKNRAAVAAPGTTSLLSSGVDRSGILAWANNADSTIRAGLQNAVTSMSEAEAAFWAGVYLPAITAGTVLQTPQDRDMYNAIVNKYHILGH